MTTTLTRRWPSSLTPGDVGKHVTVIAPGENVTVAAGVLAAVAQHTTDSGPHTHMAIISPNTISDIVTSDRHGTVLVDTRAKTAGDAVTEAIPVTPPDAHPRRRDRSPALAALSTFLLEQSLAAAFVRVLLVFFAVAVMVAGIQLAFTTPVLTLAQPLGALIFGAGGAILIRLWAIADRMRSRS